MESGSRDQLDVLTPVNFLRLKTLLSLISRINTDTYISENPCVVRLR